MEDIKIEVGKLSSAVEKELEAYAKLSAEGMKEAVRKAAKLCKREITENAPKDTGAYKKSWTTKVTEESGNSLSITVHSKMPWLPHLLEHGHAKRGGGRVPAYPHIAPAEQKAVEQLEKDIKSVLEG